MVHFSEKNIVITGHYGSGKTNLAVNLAADLARDQQVDLVDLDMVNPYFRSADFRSLSEAHGFRLHAPPTAGTALDVPVLPGELRPLIHSDTTLIVDVGGDENGATALGGFASDFATYPYIMICVINRFRQMIRKPGQAAEMVRSIEATSRLKVTHLVNNTHFAHLTTAEDIQESLLYAEQVSGITGIPIAFTAVERSLAHTLPDSSGIYPIRRYVLPPWEEQTMDRRSSFGISD